MRSLPPARPGHNLTKVQGDLKTASQNLATTVAEKDQLTSKLSGVQTELEKSKGQVAQLTNDRTSLEAQITQLTTDLQAKTQELEQRSSTGTSTTAEGGSDQQAQIAEQQTLITKLQGDLDCGPLPSGHVYKGKGRPHASEDA